MDVLYQGPLYSRVPGLGDTSRHGSDGVPVLVDVRNDLLVPTEGEPHIPVLDAGLLHVGDGSDTHLGDGWQWDITGKKVLEDTIERTTHWLVICGKSRAR